jgi:hypothetical protein
MLQLRAYFMILGGGMLAVFCLGILADVFELRMNGGPLGSFNFDNTSLQVLIKENDHPDHAC